MSETTLAAGQAGVQSVDNVHEKLFDVVAVEPFKEVRLSLGHFTSASRFKGIVVEIADSVADTVVTQILSRGTAQRYELLLSVTNHGPTLADARVLWLQ